MKKYIKASTNVIRSYIQDAVQHVIDYAADGAHFSKGSRQYIQIANNLLKNDDVKIAMLKLETALQNAIGNEMKEQVTERR